MHESLELPVKLLLDSVSELALTAVVDDLDEHNVGLLEPGKLRGVKERDVEDPVVALVAVNQRYFDLLSDLPGLKTDDALCGLVVRPSHRRTVRCSVLARDFPLGSRASHNFNRSKLLSLTDRDDFLSKGNATRVIVINNDHDAHCFLSQLDNVTSLWRLLLRLHLLAGLEQPWVGEQDTEGVVWLWLVIIHDKNLNKLNLFARAEHERALHVLVLLASLTAAVLCFEVHRNSPVVHAPP